MINKYDFFYRDEDGTVGTFRYMKKYAKGDFDNIKDSEEISDVKCMLFEIFENESCISAYTLFNDCLANGGIEFINKLDTDEYKTSDIKNAYIIEGFTARSLSIHLINNNNMLIGYCEKYDLFFFCPITPNNVSWDDFIVEYRFW